MEVLGLLWGVWRGESFSDWRGWDFSTVFCGEDSSTYWSNLPANKPGQSPDSSSRWRNLPSESLTRDPNPPPTGAIFPLSALLESRFLHPLEESSRWRASQRSDSSTYWRNLPADDYPMKRKEPQHAAVSQSAVFAGLHRQKLI